jgi:predicted transcriptional regulator
MKATPAEWDILQVLWENGPQTVREVHEALGAGGYTTTLKLMQIMLSKGLVQRDETARAHVFAAAQPREAMQGSFVAEMLPRVFGGSASALLQGALAGSKPTAEELAAMRKLLDEYEEGV